MGLVSETSHHLVTLPAGSRLVVSADSDSAGHVRVWTGRPSYVPGERYAIGPGDNKAIGPFDGKRLCRVEATRGILNYRHVTQLEAGLEQATSVIRAHRIIAAALVEREQLLKEKKAMGLQEKFANFAERARSVPKKLEERVDSMAARLDAAEKSGEEHLGNMDVILTNMEKGVAEVENAVRQLSNGAPLDGSASSSQ